MLGVVRHVVVAVVLQMDDIDAALVGSKYSRDTNVGADHNGGDCGADRDSNAATAYIDTGDGMCSHGGVAAGSGDDSGGTGAVVSGGSCAGFTYAYSGHVFACDLGASHRNHFFLRLL